MKLCIDCKHYGGVKASNGKYICNASLNSFASGRRVGDAYDASWLRMAPELQMTGCGMDAKWWEVKGHVGIASVWRYLTQP